MERLRALFRETRGSCVDQVCARVWGGFSRSEPTRRFAFRRNARFWECLWDSVGHGGWIFVLYRNSMPHLGLTNSGCLYAITMLGPDIRHQ
ncbi:hypothetical protein K474DRAFT_365970 [Panus rudis PR-1116 ss-1]|nr:hypothetical protein K474DRAFT_365970 [Panus rudis PR-1116 ss-1]